MRMPLDIHFLNLTPSEALPAAIYVRAEQPEKFCDAIISCHVTVESPHHHQHQGRRYAVRMRLAVAGATQVASRDAEVPAHEDAFAAVCDVFDVVERPLEGYVRAARARKAALGAAMKPVVRCQYRAVAQCGADTGERPLSGSAPGFTSRHPNESVRALS